MFGSASYGLAIFTIYFPFNLIKGALVSLVYELIFNRVIFHVLKSGRFQTRVFLRKSEIAEKEGEEKKRDGQR